MSERRSRDEAGESRVKRGSDGAAPSPQWDRVKAVFHGALERPPAERPAFVVAACMGDAAVRAEVESLLEASEGAVRFLSEPAAGWSDSAGLESETLARLKAALAGRYEIQRELGRGGMATVYLARDLRHRRAVALKVLAPHLLHSLGTQRFVREIETAARLSHPHLVPLFDSGEGGGLLFYTMPFVEGETLRARLAREGAFPAGEALRILREVADALAYAHEQGVVHRDLKPENILLTRGHALVADFGVAKAVAEAIEGGTGGEALTSTGFALGTPAYMAPEQAVADPNTDHRADLYALGVLAYEVLAGAHPFGARTPQRFIAAHLSEAPPPLAAARRDAPLEIAELVERCLAKDPAHRPQSAAEVLRTMEALGAGHGSASGATGTIRLAIAVLPFVSVGGGADDEYLSDGITEELLNTLAQIPTLQVAARGSSFAFKGAVGDVREVGRVLGVSAVLEGSLRRAGQRLRITARLTDAVGGFQLWSHRYDRDLRDVFELQDEIAEAIATALRATLAGRTGTAVSRRPAHLEAHDHFLRGRHALARGTREGLEQALGHFRRALESDATYAPAHAGVAEAYMWLADAHLAPAEAYPSALAAARRALECDESLPDAHSVLASVQVSFGWDWPVARRALDRALALNPSQALALFADGMYWLAMAEPRRAVESLRRLVAVDPLSRVAHAFLLLVLTFVDKPEEAIAECERRSRDVLGGFAYLDSPIGRAYDAVGRHDEAIAAFAEAEPALGHRSPGLALSYAHIGRTAKAERLLTEIEARWPATYVAPEFVAQVHATLGRNEEALRWLERGIDGRSSAAVGIRYLREFASLHGDPRFARLLERAGLPPLGASESA